MIKLFYAPGTCALALHIVLEWIGEPYDLQKVKQSDPEYLKLNPLGQVPAMIELLLGLYFRLTYRSLPLYILKVLIVIN